MPGYALVKRDEKTVTSVQTPQTLNLSRSTYVKFLRDRSTSPGLYPLQTVLSSECLGQSYGVGYRTNLKGKRIEHLIQVCDLLEGRTAWVPP